MNDSYVMQGLRKKLVEHIKHKGISNQDVLDAIGKVKRHLFVMKGLEFMAYEDKPISIGKGQTISQPYTVAFQTELLEVKRGDKILEIGTGSGYQAAVLAEIGAEVYSLERITELYTKTSELLKELDYNINVLHADGYLGLIEQAPFDKIIITAAIPQIPLNLITQLKISGILVAPENEYNGVQTMKKVIRISETRYEYQSHGQFSFVPMIGGIV